MNNMNVVNERSGISASVSSCAFPARTDSGGGGEDTKLKREESPRYAPCVCPKLASL